MPKKPERSEIEYLRGLCKRLEAENKHLRRRNRKLESKKHIFESEYPRYENTIETEDTYPCPECGKGNMHVVIELKDKIIEACDLCSHRNVVKLESEDEDRS